MYPAIDGQLGLVVTSPGSWVTKIQVGHPWTVAVRSSNYSHHTFDDPPAIKAFDQGLADIRFPTH